MSERRASRSSPPQEARDAYRKTVEHRTTTLVHGSFACGEMQRQSRGVSHIAPAATGLYTSSSKHITFFFLHHRRLLTSVRCRLPDDDLNYDLQTQKPRGIALTTSRK
jgi:hypothetical protein